MPTVMSLRIAERQVALAQWQRSGQCMRCFHASHRAAADARGSSAELPRQRRLSKISDEVSKVRGQETRGAQRADDGRPGFSSEMVQTRARVMKSDADMEDEPRNPTHRTEQQLAESKEEPTERPKAPTRELPRHQPNLQKAVKAAIEKNSVPYTPKSPTSKSLLQAGYGAATPVGKNHAGLIADRLAMVDPSFAAPHLRSEEQINRKKVNNQAVMQFPEGSQTKSVRGPVSRRIKHHLLSRLVTGNFWDNGHLSKQEKEDWAGKAPWLDSTLNSLIMNGSYTKQDVQEFKERVLKFMPVPAAAGAKAAPKKEAARAA